MKTKSFALLALLLAATASAPAASAGPALASSPETIQPLPVGSAAPSVVLKTAEGADFDLGSALRRKPTVLVFYKAGWCGLGAKNLGQLSDNQSRFDQLGYQIIAISTDQPAHLRPTKLKHGLTYTLLSDAELRAAPAYGVAYRASRELIDSYAAKKITLAPIPGERDGNRWLLVPAVYLVGRDGRVKWAHSDPRANPSLQSLVDAAEAALK